MSHFTTIKTQIQERAFLLRALADLHCSFEEGGLHVYGYGGIRTPVEIRVATSNPQYSIGFRKVGAAYEVVADWEEIRGIKPADFLNRLTQRYAYHTACAKLQEQGFTIASEETQKDGQIHLVLRRFT